MYHEEVRISEVLLQYGPNGKRLTVLAVVVVLYYDVVVGELSGFGTGYSDVVTPSTVEMKYGVTEFEVSGGHIIVIVEDIENDSGETRPCLCRGNAAFSGRDIECGACQHVVWTTSSSMAE